MTCNDSNELKQIKGRISLFFLYGRSCLHPIRTFRHFNHRNRDKHFRVSVQSSSCKKKIDDFQTLLFLHSISKINLNFDTILMIWITCWKLFAIMKIHQMKITCIYTYTLINCVVSILVSHDHFPDTMWLINWNWYTIFLYFSRDLSKQKRVPLIVLLMLIFLSVFLPILLDIIFKNLCRTGNINILDIYSRTLNLSMTILWI